MLAIPATIATFLLFGILTAVFLIPQVVFLLFISICFGLYLKHVSLLKIVIGICIVSLAVSFLSVIPLSLAYFSSVLTNVFHTKQSVSIFWEIEETFVYITVGFCVMRFYWKAKGRVFIYMFTPFLFSLATQLFFLPH